MSATILDEPTRTDHVHPAASSSPSTALSLRLVMMLVVIRLLLPLLTRARIWEFHRDEFLYFAMADHFDLWHMQFPPMIALIAGAGRLVFGDSVLAARVPAAIGGAALTAVILLLIRRLGGGSRAAILATLALLAAPVFVRTSLLMHPVIFDQLWSTMALAALTLAAHERAPRWWIGVGVALGLGALTKFSIAFVGLSVVVAVALNAELRTQLRSRWPWFAVIVGAAMSAPSVLGQITHHWPFLQQMQALSSGQLKQVSAATFLANQPLLLASASLCVIAGFAASIRGPARDRVPVSAAVAMITLMLLLHGKGYYAAPVYPVVIAIGALQLERLSAARPWIAPVAATFMLGCAIIVWPLGVPVFAPSTMIRYAASLGSAETVKTNRGELLQLPQDYADMLSWRALADSVGAVVARLPAEQRRDLTIIGSNYGQAGALAFYSRRTRIPYPRSTAGDFWAWGPGPGSGNNVIVVGSSAEIGDALRQLYESVEEVRVIANPLGVPEEQRVTIYHARGARAQLASVWPTLGPNWE